MTERARSGETFGVLVVDDSALMRNLVGKMIESAPDLTVLATAMNGRFALQKLDRLQPDVICLDIEMPEMNGIEFLRALSKKAGRRPPVIILSSVAVKGSKITMEALATGASDFVTKPSGAISHDIHVVEHELLALLRGYAAQFRRSLGAPVPARSDQQQVTVHPRETTKIAEPSPRIARQRSGRANPRTPQADPGTLEIIAMGISTGGPNALRKVFAELDADLGVPVVVVQHMPAGFTLEFAASLNRGSPLEIKEAAEGDLLKPNRVLIAPGNYHMRIERRSLGAVTHICDDAPCNGHRPSADVLFASVAEQYGRHAMAVIMTGMGRDGAQEIGAIYEAGGMTIGQDEASSVVYGMPRVAQENGYLHKQVPLQEMAQAINGFARRHRDAS